MQSTRWILGAAIAGALAVASTADPLSGQQTPANAQIITGLRNTGDGLRIRQRSSRTNLPRFASADGAGIQLTLPASASAVDRAYDFIAVYGKTFGVDGLAGVRAAREAPRDTLGGEHVRLEQVHQGFRVRGGELIVHLRGDRVMAVNGNVVGQLPATAQVAIGAASALQVAQQTIAKFQSASAGGATYTVPVMEWHNPAAARGESGPAHLAWFIEATNEGLRQWIWIDAGTGAVLDTIDQLMTAPNRSVYTANNTTSLPGTLLRSEAQGLAGDADADSAYDSLGDAYTYFFTAHGRNSFDNAGSGQIASVHYGSPSSTNASWNGVQTSYSNGFATDDVVGHEFAHGVTQYAASLVYLNQSGALNEAFSDIFGETIDLVNGRGNDSSGVRWHLGEDLPNGAIRHMMVPTAGGDPGKVSDAQWSCSASDNGGVHTNSGVANHAFALMVDGGTYNGQTISGIGLAQAAAIHYRVLTTYLTSFSTYLDHAAGLNQACSDLVGTNGITSAMCTEVSKAITAVEMTAAATRCEAAPPPLCSAGTPTPLMADGFEASTTNWVNSSTGTGSWARKANLALTGTYSALGTNVSTVSDHRYAMTQSVTVPANAWLYFDHTYAFETPAYDGGVLEVSNDAGASWWDAAGYIDGGAGYTGTIAAGWGNPLGGRSAFVGRRFAWVGTRLNLAPFAGFNVRFRFRVGTDSGFSAPGWAVDNVSLYTCATAPPPGAFGKIGPANGVTGLGAIPMPLRLSWNPSAGATSYEYCVDTTNDNVCGGSWTSTGTNTTADIGGSPGTRYWQARAVSAGGTTPADGNTWWSFSIGPPWPDLNHDGKPDIVFQNQNSGVMYSWFLGGTNGTTLIGEAVLPSTTTDWALVGKDDFTKDGNIDLLWQNTSTSAVRLWEMNGTSLVNIVPWLSGTGPWTIVATGDLNGDALADIVFQQLSTGRLYAWLMNGLTIVSDGAILDAADQWGLADPGWRVVSIADMDFDLRNDLVWQHADGRVRVWYLDGLKERATGVIFGGSTPWRVRMVTDFNNNFRPDILWQNPSGYLYVWFLNGAALASDGFVTPSQVASQWKVVGGK